MSKAPLVFRFSSPCVISLHSVNGARTLNGHCFGWWSVVAEMVPVSPCTIGVDRNAALLVFIVVRNVNVDTEGHSDDPEFNHRPPGWESGPVKPPELKVTLHSVCVKSTPMNEKFQNVVSKLMGVNWHCFFFFVGLGNIGKKFGHD